MCSKVWSTFGRTGFQIHNKLVYTKTITSSYRSLTDVLSRIFCVPISRRGLYVLFRLTQTYWHGKSVNNFTSTQISLSYMSPFANPQSKLRKPGKLTKAITNCIGGPYLSWSATSSVKTTTRGIYGTNFYTAETSMRWSVISRQSHNVSLAHRLEVCCLTWLTVLTRHHYSWCAIDISHTASRYQRI